MSRSGYDDEKSRSVINRIERLGSHVDLLRGDVSNFRDVQEVFSLTKVPIGGIVNGAMVLLVRPSWNGNGFSITPKIYTLG